MPKRVPMSGRILCFGTRTPNSALWNDSQGPREGSFPVGSGDLPFG